MENLQLGGPQFENYLHSHSLSPIKELDIIPSLDLPLLLMEDNNRPIIRFAGEESMTLGSTCMVTKEGKSSSTESVTAL